MRRPTTCVARPRRTTSTSGSSGTGPRGRVGQGTIGSGRPVGAGWPVGAGRSVSTGPVSTGPVSLQGGVGGGGGVLLCFFLGATGALPAWGAAQQHLRGEHL